MIYFRKFSSKALILGQEARHSWKKPDSTFVFRCSRSLRLGTNQCHKFFKSLINRRHLVEIHFFWSTLSLQAVQSHWGLWRASSLKLSHEYVELHNLPSKKVKFFDCPWIFISWFWVINSTLKSIYDSNETSHILMCTLGNFTILQANLVYKKIYVSAIGLSFCGH